MGVVVGAWFVQEEQWRTRGNPWSVGWLFVSPFPRQPGGPGGGGGRIASVEGTLVLHRVDEIIEGLGLGCLIGVLPQHGFGRIRILSLANPDGASHEVDRMFRSNLPSLWWNPPTHTHTNMRG